MKNTPGLCSICNQAYDNRFEIVDDKDCYICHGLIGKILKESEKIPEILKEKRVNTFSFSTAIPPSVFNREEHIFDYNLNVESVKSTLNRQIAKKIIPLGFEYWSEGDIHFTLSESPIFYTYYNIFIFGRYKKLKAGYSQTRWTCSNCNGKGCSLCNYTGKRYTSLEEIIGAPAKKELKAQNYYLHASGREDVDVCNYGGRPFVLEIVAPKLRKLDLHEYENKINETGIVKIYDLKYVERGHIALVSDSHFDKDYTGTVLFSKPLTKEEEDKIGKSKNVVLNQRTPNRVQQRRADLIRKRYIYNINIVEKIDDRQYKIYIEAEAGTYIKEFIHGDNGKTKPNITDLISDNKNLTATCEKLEVSKIRDEFLDIVIKLQQ